MPRVNPRKLSSKDKMKYLDILWTSIAELKSRDEVKNFFKDLLSESESIMLARRILIAKYLLEDKTYDQIHNRMKVGFDTIARVHNWLISGFGGYENSVKKFEKVLYNRLKRVSRASKIVEPFSFNWLKRKYPLHFLLFNIIDDVKESRKIKKKIKDY